MSDSGAVANASVESKYLVTGDVLDASTLRFDDNMHEGRGS